MWDNCLRENWRTRQWCRCRWGSCIWRGWSMKSWVKGPIWYEWKEPETSQRYQCHRAAADESVSHVAEQRHPADEQASGDEDDDTGDTFDLPRDMPFRTQWDGMGGPIVGFPMDAYLTGDGQLASAGTPIENAKLGYWMELVYIRQPCSR